MLKQLLKLPSAVARGLRHRWHSVATEERTGAKEARALGVGVCVDDAQRAAVRAQSQRYAQGATGAHKVERVARLLTECEGANGRRALENFTAV